MADSNQIRRADLDFADNDPFAELTRIMGHDPRPASASVKPDEQASAGDPLELERELARDLDFGEFDEPSDDDRPAVQASVEQDEPVAVSADDETADWRMPVAEVPEFQDAPAEAFADEEAAEPLEALMPSEPEAVSDQAELAIEEDFAEAFEQELQVREEAEPELAAVEDPADPAMELADEPDEAFVDEPEVATLVADTDDAVEPQLAQDAWDLPAEDAAAIEPDPVESAAEPAEEPYVQAPHTYVAPEPQAYIAPQPAAAVFSDEISLEDELNALLAGSAPTPSVDVPQPVAAAPAPIPTVESAPIAASPVAAAMAAMSSKAPAAEAWRPSIHTFGRANFMAPRTETPVAAAPVAAPAQPEPDEAPTQPEPVEAFAQPEPVAETVAEAAAVEAGPETDEIPDLLGDLELHLDVDDIDLDVDEPVTAPDEPVAAQAVSEPAAAPTEPYAPAVPDDDTPAIETIEVVEGAMAIADDLDIPDVDYGTPAPRVYDELGNEFDHAFGELSLDEPAQQQPAARQPEPFDWGAMAPAEPSQPDADQSAQPADERQPPLQEGSEFDYETDLKQAIAMSAYEDDEPEEQAPRRRGLVVAAFVAAVAVVGGAGVFGMSIFGGGSDSPAVVLADSDPMKVRPENPGGTTVPNQNNEVYQRVADGASAALPPSQERLINTAEDPVDIGADDEVALLPSGIGDDVDELPAAGRSLDDEPAAEGPASEAAALPKSDERIEQEPEVAASGLPGDLAVVAPRRVRTMVVRPDGSMVPREEPTPSTAGQAGEMVVASVPSAAAPALAPVASQLPPAAAAEDEGGPDVETPDRVSVLPAPRIEPEIEPFDVIPPAEPAVAVERPEPTPVLAPATAAAAAAGAWSMQIASQPSAEGAQSTYQDLARRYGNVLQGRGVNIVRANIAGKGVYYRVRIPAQTRDEAIQLCTRYKSAGGSCFVSR